MDGKTSAKSKIKAENCMENPPIHSVGSEWISMDLSFPSKRERDNFFPEGVKSAWFITF